MLQNLTSAPIYAGRVIKKKNDQQTGPKRDERVPIKEENSKFYRTFKLHLTNDCH